MRSGNGPTAWLYNLVQDPAETSNVAAKHPDKVAELRELLARITAAASP